MLLERYIFRQLLRNFLLLLVVVTGTVLLASMLQAIGRHQELSLAIILNRLPYLLPMTLGLSIPLSLLVGTLLTYGRLSSDNEILAIHVAGIHPRRTIVPAIALALALSLVALLVNGALAPMASIKAREVTNDDVRRFLETLQARRVTHFESDAMKMYWQGVDEEGWLVDFGFEITPAEGSRLEGEASRAKIWTDMAGEILGFDLRDVDLVSASGRDDTHLEEKEVSFPIAELFGFDAELEDKGRMTSTALRYRVLRDPALGRRKGAMNLVRYRIEYFSRIALALSCLVFVLVGVPVGILFRRGSFVGATFVALVLAFAVYYPLHELGRNLASEGTVRPALAVAIPGVTLTAVGVVLLSRVLRR